MIKVFIIYLIFQSTLKTVWCEETLAQRNVQNELNPLHENTLENVNKDHNKRTIFNSGGQNVGWAKHVGLHPSGFRYVIGYGPVDFKYVPVLRPPIKLVSLQHIHRPRWPSKVVRPVLPIRPIHQHGWRPIQPIAKPVQIKPVVPLRPFIPVVKPAVPIASPAPQWPNKSWQPDEWKQKPVVVKPTLPLTPVQLVHVQAVLKPIPPPQLTPVQQLIPVQPILKPVSPPQVVPVKPLVPAQSVVPTHPVAVSNPWVPSVKPAYDYPLVGQQQFFEVARPNLPVLPLGASFPSPVLQQVPTGPGVVVHKPHVIQPHFIQRNPGTIVEYHGTHNVVPLNGFINFPKLASVQPQYSPQFIQTNPQHFASHVHPTNVNIHQNPFPSLSGGQQAVQYPTPQQQLPEVNHFHNHLFHQHYSNGQQTVQFPSQQQQHQQVIQIQQLPQQGPQLTEEQYAPPFGHGNLPLEGESFDQQEQQNPPLPSTQTNFFSQGQEQHYNENQLKQEQFPSSSSIQPGQTDNQTPLYLPPHPSFNTQVESFNNGFSSQFLPSQEDGLNSFRPSDALEAPYTNFGFNRREDVQADDVTENYYRVNGTETYQD